MSEGQIGRTALCLAALSLTQCTKARTELVVTVRSELAWGTGRDMQSLVVTVRRDGPGGAIRWQQTKVLGDEAGQWRIPLSFGLYPADASDATPVWIEVLGCASRDGCVARSALVSQRAVVSYWFEQSVGLDLWLAARCVGVVCGGSERCVRATGRCELAHHANDDVRALPGGMVPGREDALTLAADVSIIDEVMDATSLDIAVADAPMDRIASGEDVPGDLVVARDADVGVSDAFLGDRSDAGSPDADVPVIDGADVADVTTDGPCVGTRSLCAGTCVEHHVNPSTCSSAVNLGAYCGDTSCGTLCPATRYRTVATQMGLTSQWFRARAVECTLCSASVVGRVILTVPPGVDYDIYVYRPCGTLVGRSLNLAGVDESVEVTQPEDPLADDSFDYFIEVRHTSGASCAPWTLTLEARGSNGSSC